MENTAMLNFKQIKEYVDYYYRGYDFILLRDDIDSGVLPSVDGLESLVGLVKYAVSRWFDKMDWIMQAPKDSPYGLPDPFTVEKQSSP
ncbi:MAG: hypothetical protein J7K01_02575 [Thermovirga sp.]|nr:hypothetical protein [Thermovirga sp.]